MGRLQCKTAAYSDYTPQSRLSGATSGTITERQ